jgi:hypothetical protein
MVILAKVFHKLALPINFNGDVNPIHIIRNFHVVAHALFKRFEALLIFRALRFLAIRLLRLAFCRVSECSTELKLMWLNLGGATGLAISISAPFGA